MTRAAMTRAALDRLLLAVAAALALVGVAALLWPTRLPVAVAPLALAPPPDVPADTAAAHDSAHAAAVVQANVFSATRRPPAVRYVPEASAGASDAGVEAPVLPEPTLAIPADAAVGAPIDSEAPAAPTPVPALFGIVADPQGAVALLRLDARLPGARAYRAGDRGGAYRVVRVGATDVVLDGPAGRRTLRLAGIPRTRP